MEEVIKNCVSVKCYYYTPLASGHSAVFITWVELVYHIYPTPPLGQDMTQGHVRSYVSLYPRISAAESRPLSVLRCSGHSRQILSPKEMISF